MQEAYTYRNLPIPGGGYVTGFVFHENEPAVLYLRTDIGGTYRFDSDRQQWKSLIDHVNMNDLRETFPIAVALDPANPAMLYIACGIWQKPPGRLAVSSDYGEHFTYYDMPMRVHGNLNGRGTGFRLIVDHRDSRRLYFASQADGLWTSPDGGKTWDKIPAMPEDYLTFVGQTGDGTALFVGGAGVTTRRGGALRGRSLYVSYDGGRTFSQLWQPEDGGVEGVKLAGLVAQRYALDKHYLYVTFSVMGPNAYVLEHGYSCDGGSVIGGRVVRYPIGKDGRIGHGDDITPDISCGGGANMFDTPERENRTQTADKPVCAQRMQNPAAPERGQCTHTSDTLEREQRTHTLDASDSMLRERASDTVRNKLLDYGFGGISCSVQYPGLVVASTVSKEDGDCICRSFDYGQHWEVILYDLSVGRMEFRTSYMKPQYNGGHSIIHWLTDLKINPFQPQELWFNTGTGVFCTRNLLEDSVVFSDWCDGLEETVHLNLYSPPKGEVQLVDILGDLGGFAFCDIDRPCDNSFADAEGNRYITCINADYAEGDPDTVVVTPRGNWTGRTKGGLILSKDQCRTFTRLPMPYGLTERIDRALKGIEHPNVNSGWAAISPDGMRIVWSIADNIFLPADMVVTSTDGGSTFRKANVYNLDGICISDYCMTDAEEESADELQKITKNEIRYAYGMKVFSDRVDSSLFYGFGRHFEFYVSTDSGCNFYQKELSADSMRGCPAQNTAAQGISDADANQNVTASYIPHADFSIIDTANKTEVRADSSQSGLFYMALGEYGLYRLHYDSATDRTTLRKLSRDGDTFYRLGLGIPYPGADYATSPKALYTAATIDGTCGFYRTVDEGQTFVRLNTDAQMYGEINSVEGDSRTYGRFYIATGSRGVLCGEPTSTAPRAPGTPIYPGNSNTD